MRINPTQLIYGAVIVASAFLSACGGGGAAAPAPATTYTISVNVSGLAGTVVLQNNGGDDLSISADGSFPFATPLAGGANYAVAVKTQPSGQVCSVNPLSGTVAAANITVAVTCAASSNTYTIGGTVNGLTGTVVLQNNGGDNYTVSASTPTFTFNTALASGATYTVTVLTQPFGQTCTVDTPTNTGTVATANIGNVAVTCVTATTTYTIGGSASGLTGTVVLQNSSGDDLTITAPGGNFAFNTRLANGVMYIVTVLTQPSGQTCTLLNNVGTVAGANVTNVAVTCSTATYSIGGGITNLGNITGLVLQNNGGDNLSVNANATSFIFGTKLPSGTTYNVTVLTQPSGKTCTVNSPSGPVTSQNISSVSVICALGSYTVGGNVANLTGSGLVLQNNGADDRAVAALASSYTFTSQASGSTYNVTVKTQPTSPAQVCTVANPSGTISANVINANVTCVNAYTIGGTITGAAAGIGPVLQNNGGDNLFIPAITTGATNFTFSTPIADLTTYSVTQLIRARVPSQNCSAIVGGSGTVNGGPVTVSITCSLSPVVPKFAYVTNSTANPALDAADTVSAFTIGGTGALTVATTPTTASGDGPYAVAVDPTGQFAYVVNSNSDSVSAYGVVSVSGALTVIDANDAIAGSQPSILTGDNPKSIAIHPSGKFAYVANQGNGFGSGNTLSAYSINMASGALSMIDADAVTPLTQPTIVTGTFPYAVTVDPLGKFAYVTNYNSNDISVYTIDQVTGALTPVGTAVAAGTNPSSIAIDPTGKCALVANNTSNNVMSYTINPTTGALNSVTTTTPIASSAPRSVAIDPGTGLYAYVANAGLASVSAFSVTLATCAIAEIDADAGAGGPTIAAGSTPISINVDPSGQFVYVANLASNSVSVYSIGVGGALTWVDTLQNGAGPTSVTTTQ